MQTEVVMPQMGESVAEGTVTEWLKEVGDYVERDEPLFLITTDKVDADVPCPKEGTLVEKRVEPGESVEVNSVVAVIDTEAEEGEAVSSGDPGDSGDTEGSEDSKKPADVAASETKTDFGDGVPSTSRGSGDFDSEDVGNGKFPSKAELRRKRSTPVVRRIAREHDIQSLEPIPGSGLSGRVTKEDILEYIEEGKHKQQAERTARQISRQPRDIEGPDIEIGPRDQTEGLSEHRKMIAEHMVRSRQTSPHAHTVHEVDFGRVEDLMDEKANEYKARGAKLTYTAFLLKAAAEALQAFPLVNSVMADEDEIVYRGDINIGMAVALEKSLIVPVIDNADELSLLGLARQISDVADRARNRQLDPNEVKGGTFTVSNHGVFGPEFGIPIINQPQSAILSTGAVKKRVKVDQQTEAIQIRPTGYWCLSFDHRVIDGATADKFMKHMKETIENWSG